MRHRFPSLAPPNHTATKARHLPQLPWAELSVMIMLGALLLE